jgi:DNA polymerase III subunit epsilon
LNKIAYIDLETTGVNPYANGIHQIAGIIEIDGVEKEVFDFKVKPFEKDIIDPTALKVSQLTKEDIMGYPDPHFVYKDFTTLLGKHVNKFDKKDKLYFVGFNSTFDFNFLREFFSKCGDPYFGSWFWNPPIDLFQLVNYQICFRDKKRESIPHMNLKAVAEYFGIDTSKYNLHDALDDIRLTKEVYKIITGV